MPTSPTRVTNSLYMQCIVDQNVPAAYVPVLQNQVAAICQASGMPGLQSQIVANPLVFAIQEIRYTVHPQGVLVQLGLNVVYRPDSGTSKSEASAIVLPSPEKSLDPADASSDTP
ncbi:hypothetical protein HMJ29_17730 [Hymenobacter taeanensis]|uniref:Uncharacterized protein n=1 Tax=Hymenobacter taeanensis TaxID=2735321 RepID=A0A6M6BLE5_9BACT|nr:MULTISPECIES: hypothetical protein [Hymenobacter]QJX48658.1 hypothetical protein HMJ29_17730 [Hymenobacter taeanensis]UOQ81843.1 hypothetical protein MUN83_03360 [Hymenobacter sp. 5414T-23]